MVFIIPMEKSLRIQTDASKSKSKNRAKHRPDFLAGANSALHGWASVSVSWRSKPYTDIETITRARDKRFGGSRAGAVAYVCHPSGLSPPAPPVGGWATVYPREMRLGIGIVI